MCIVKHPIGYESSEDGFFYLLPGWDIVESQSLCWIEHSKIQYFQHINKNDSNNS